MAPKKNKSSCKRKASTVVVKKEEAEDETKVKKQKTEEEEEGKGTAPTPAVGTMMTLLNAMKVLKEKLYPVATQSTTELITRLLKDVHQKQMQQQFDEHEKTSSADVKYGERVKAELKRCRDAAVSDAADKSDAKEVEMTQDLMVKSLQDKRLLCFNACIISESESKSMYGCAGTCPQSIMGDVSTMKIDDFKAKYVTQHLEDIKTVIQGGGTAPFSTIEINYNEMSGAAGAGCTGMAPGARITRAQHKLLTDNTPVIQALIKRLAPDFESVNFVKGLGVTGIGCVDSEFAIFVD